MKLCWDTIDNFTVTKNGYFKYRLRKEYYIYKDSCKHCGDPYLARRNQLSKGRGTYCSKECCYSTRTDNAKLNPQGLKRCTRCKKIKEVSDFYKDAQQSDNISPYCKVCRKTYYLNNAERIKIATRQYNYLNREKRAADSRKRYWADPEASRKNHAEWYEKNKDYSKKYNSVYRENNKEKIKDYIEKNKEGIRRRSLKRAKSKCSSEYLLDRIIDKDPRYKAYFNEGFVHIKCYYCKEYFVPITKQVEHFLTAEDGFSNMYCSDPCKDKCVEYRFIASRWIDPRSIKYVEPSDQKKTRNCQTDHLKQLQIDDVGYNYCEKCGKETEVDLHHTLEVAKYGLEAISSASHMLVCEDCHKEFTKKCRN